MDKLKIYFAKLIESNFYETGKKLEVTENLKKNLNFCINWITGIEEETIKIKENKGLLLFGTVGLGKSAILKAMCTLLNELYNISAKYYTANQIANIWRYMAIDEEANNNHNRIKTSRILLIDDIGTEDLKVYKSYPLPEVIRERYDSGRITCYSTNDNPMQLSIKYSSSIEEKISHGTYLLKFIGNTKRDI